MRGQAGPLRSRDTQGLASRKRCHEEGHVQEGTSRPRQARSRVATLPRGCGSSATRPFWRHRAEQLSQGVFRSRPTLTLRGGPSKSKLAAPHRELFGDLFLLVHRKSAPCHWKRVLLTGRLCGPLAPLCFRNAFVLRCKAPTWRVFLPLLLPPCPQTSVGFAWCFLSCDDLPFPPPHPSQRLVPCLHWACRLAGPPCRGRVPASHPF